MRFRPPAVHLVVHGPYFRVWSMSDRLNDDRTKHWTGKSQVFVTMLQVDGKAYWIMGREPRSIPALPLVSYEVVPKRPVVGGVLIKMLADPALVKMWRRH